MGELKLKKHIRKIIQINNAIGSLWSKLNEHSSSNKSSLSDFKLLKNLGQGGFGRVIMAEQIKTEEVFAIKAIEKKMLIEEDLTAMSMFERSVLTIGCENRFLTNLHSSFQSVDHVFFVMEYVSGGDLLFHWTEGGKFSVERAKFYTAELVLGLQFLHSRGIIYRDLKLDNVMLTSDGHVKIADFGMAKTNIKDGVKTNSFCGSPSNIAPEVLMESDYDGSVDWWALGVLLFEMLVGKSPFMHRNEEVLFRMIRTKSVYIPMCVDSPGRELILDLLVKDPAKRLGCREVGELEINDHPFFDGIDWEDLANGKVEAPFKPKVKGPQDIQNFDNSFTNQPAEIPPVCMNEEMMKIADNSFAGFSFYNPHFSY